MSMPLGARFGQPEIVGAGGDEGPPPLAAFAGDQFDAARDDLDGVIRLWLSSIRSNYRRSIRGRSNLTIDGGVPTHGRHRAA